MRTNPLFSSLLVIGLVITGCSSTSSSSWLDPMRASSPVHTGVASSAGASLQQLQAARVCCSGLDQIPTQPLDTKRTSFHEITEASPAFRFATGKSFFTALALPDNLDRATITIEAIAGATVFVPTVLILDNGFTISRAIESEQFAYTPAGFMEPQRLKGSFSIDRRYGSNLARERYLVVFTTAEDLRGSTQMVSEARLYARSRGLADPGLPDPVAPHAATGVIRVSTSGLETSVKSSKTYVQDQNRARRYVEPEQTSTRRSEPAPAPAPTPAAPTAETSGSSAQPMLSETRQIYDRMIRESVRSGDMDRAWRLVQEAERAGSSSARRTFLEAVERK